MNNAIRFVSGAFMTALCSYCLATPTWTLMDSPSGVSVSAYSNTGGTDDLANSLWNGSSQTIQSATLNPYGGGFGITNADACNSGSYCDLNESDTPQHSIDNEQRYDMALLSFSSLVKLTEVQLGWTSNDSDVTVMAYTGATPFALNTHLVGRTYSQLTSSGWTAIGNYSDVGSWTPTAINSSGVFSSYWLIGAYNPLAAPTGGAVTENGTMHDYVKLFSVTGTPQISVPEPGSWALVSLALLTLVAVRRTRAV